MRKKLRAVEQEVLTEGMYVRFVVNLRWNSGIFEERLFEKLQEFENVKHVEKTESDQILFVLFVNDPNKEPQFTDVRKMITRICEILHPLDWYNIHFITSNKGSYDCHITGQFAYDAKYEQPSHFDVQYIIPDTALEELDNRNSEYHEALRAYRYEHKRLLKTYSKKKDASHP